MININNLNCASCPAIHFKRSSAHRKSRKDAWNRALEKQKDKTACIILLCESTPAHAFVYDPGTNSNLRKNLREELVPGKAMMIY